jgi:hypothetical protein
MRASYVEVLETAKKPLQSRNGPAETSTMRGPYLSVGEQRRSSGKEI